MCMVRRHNCPGLSLALPEDCCKLTSPQQSLLLLTEGHRDVEMLILSYETEIL